MIIRSKNGSEEDVRFTDENKVTSGVECTRMGPCNHKASNGSLSETTWFTVGIQERFDRGSQVPRPVKYLMSWDSTYGRVLNTTRTMTTKKSRVRSAS